MRDRVFQRENRTPRVSAHAPGVVAEAGAQLVEIGDGLRDRERAASAGATAAALIVANDRHPVVEHARERFEVVPHARAAVTEYEGRSGTGRGVPEHGPILAGCCRTPSIP